MKHRIEIFSAGCATCKETIESVKRAGIKGNFVAASGGFSDFIVRREGEDFLKT